MEAIILAGGFGTRLAQVVRDVPKPMAPVAGKPFLQYLADDLIEQGVTRMVFAVCYKKEVIMSFFGKEYRGAEVCYSVEEQPLFTGGAIRLAQAQCREDRVLVLNGDSYLGMDLRGMRAFAEKRNAPVVIAVRQMTNFSRYGEVTVNERSEITAFHEKRFCEKGFINGGIYDVAHNALDGYPVKFSIENECFPELVKNGSLLAFPADGMFIDIGIPEDYERAQQLFKGR